MKKKLIAIFSTICLIVSSFAVFTVNTSAYSTGDMNNDKKFNAIDSALMTKQILGMDVPELVKIEGDINHDDKINSVDLSLLKKAIIGTYSISDTAYKINSVNLGGIDLSEYSIVVPSEYPLGSYIESMDYAVEILQKYIKEACGITPQKTNSAAGNCITFCYNPEFGSDAFTIDITNGNVTIICGLSRAPLYAAFGFLKDIIGYKFYTKDVIILEEQEDVTAKSGYSHSEGFNTPFTYRDTYTYSRLRWKIPDSHSLAYSTTYVAHHNTGMWDGCDWINSAKYGFGYGPNRNHSTFLYVPNFDKGNGRACYTNEDNIQECITNVKAAVSALLNAGCSFEAGTMPMISLSIDDTDAWCVCRNCSKYKREYGAQSASLMYFINRVNECLIKDYPLIEFWTLAYLTAIIPPENMDIADNLYICFAPICHCSNHTLDRDGCISDPGYSCNPQWLDGWLKLTDKIHIWWYQCNYYYTAVPVPNMIEIYDNIQWMVKKGVKGVFTENEDTTLGFPDLYTYLISELLWNPDITKDEYLQMARDFFRDYYGAEELYDVFMVLEEAGDKAGDWMYCGKPHEMYEYSFLAEKYDYIISTIENAREKITDPELLARYNRAVVSVYFITLSAANETEYTNGTSASKQKYSERYQWMYNWFVNNAGTYVMSHFTDDTNATIPTTFDPSVSPDTWYIRTMG